MLDSTIGEDAMLGGFGITELLIVLVIVLVLFGVGRISKIAGEMGTGIRSFKEGLQGTEDEESEDEDVKTEETEEEN